MRQIQSKYGNSSFWLDKFDDDVTDSILNTTQRNTLKLYKLSSKKKAISNFVSIVTKQNIPVKFKTRGSSYTNGKSVVISSKIEDPKDFDVAVGLALHEGSHIKLTNFDTLRDLFNIIHSYEDGSEYVDKAHERGISYSEVIKDLLNWVEDRRIDNFVYKSSPGYRDYYLSLYEKYFNDKLIEKALQSEEKTDETLDSYLFRVINLQSRSTRLDALNGLSKIYNIANLPKISRLRNTEEALEVAWEIFKVIVDSISLPNFQDEQSTDNSTDSDDISDEEFQELADKIINGENTEVSDGEGEKNDGGGVSIKNLPDNLEGESTDESSNGSKSTKTLTDRQKSILEKKIQKQKDFIRGDISKKSVSKREETVIENLEKASSELINVGSQFTDYLGKIAKGVDVIVVKKMTMDLINTIEFPLSLMNWMSSAGLSTTAKIMYEDSVNEGLRLGKMLGKRLKVRSESRDTIYNRQKSGKIDKRFISSLGFGNENVFYTKEVDQYKTANLHVSIDASGSMNGKKWTNTLTNTVALCKAVDMVPNLDIQVSIRTTSSNTPYVVMAYDSRVDKVSKLNLFKYLSPTGTTPEGLCFEAIQGLMVSAGVDKDSYFLNISDGEPYFENNQICYVYEPAALHIKKEVQKFKEKGIKVMSYFVSDSYNSDYEKRYFKKAYGNSSQFIDVTSLHEITKTMNSLFLEK